MPEFLFGIFHFSDVHVRMSPRLQTVMSVYSLLPCSQLCMFVTSSLIFRICHTYISLLAFTHTTHSAHFFSSPPHHHHRRPSSYYSVVAVLLLSLLFLVSGYHRRHCGYCYRLSSSSSSPKLPSSLSSPFLPP